MVCATDAFGLGIGAGSSGCDHEREEASSSKEAHVAKIDHRFFIICSFVLMW
jgi:hypothetical protein